MKKICFILICLALIGSLSGCNDAQDSAAPQKREYEEFLLNTTVSLSGQMCSLAESSYASLFTYSDEQMQIVSDFAANTYEQPQQAFIITLSEDKLLQMMEPELKVSEIPENIRNHIEKRLPATIPNLINSHYGANVLAAVSILTVSNSYQAPENFTENVSVLMGFNTDYAVMASFMASEEGTVMVSAAPVCLTEITRESQVTSSALKEYFESCGIPKPKITEISKETINRFFPAE